LRQLAREADAIRQVRAQQQPANGDFDLRRAGARAPIAKPVGCDRSHLVTHLARQGDSIRRRHAAKGCVLGLPGSGRRVVCPDHVFTLPRQMTGHIAIRPAQLRDS
jgi:hypothetical protein